MKKIIIALLIALIIPACVFAGRGLIDLTLGVTASSSYDIDDVKKGALKEFKFEALRFGADAELKLAFVALDAKGFYDSANKGLSGLFSANLAVDIFFARVKAGLGYAYTYNIDSKEFYFGNGIDGGYASDISQFEKANFDVNVGVDVLLGPLTVGAYATLPTTCSIENGQWGDIVKALGDNWASAKLGVTVGFALL